MATATVKKKSGDWFAETESVTLVLTAEEAATLYLLCARTFGPSQISPARHTDAIYVGLGEVIALNFSDKAMGRTPEFYESDIQGYFK